MRSAIYNTFLVGLNSPETKALPCGSSDEDCDSWDKKPSVSQCLALYFEPTGAPMDSPFHQDSVDVAVIGAGFSGTMAAVHLLKQTDDRITVALVERTSEFGRGLAYGTRDITHRLNVPAAKMGAFRREHFSENISKNCSRRPKRFHPVCEKFPPKQSIWCRFLMVPFGSNSLLVRRSLPIK